MIEFLTNKYFMGAVAIGLAIAGFLIWLSHERSVAFDAGWTKHAAGVAAQDQGALDAVQDRRNALAGCRSRGLRWNRETGNCEG